MAKPPADADPEKFIIGRGVYDNLRTARPYHDEAVFRIDPEPMPVLSIAIYNALFAAASFGLYWGLKYPHHGQPVPWIVYGAPLGIGFLTCVGFTAVVCYAFGKAWRLGPWLVYDKANRLISLPRDGVKFERQEVIHIQYITTKSLARGGAMGNDRHSELNLVTCRDGRRERWPLLRSIFTHGAFDYVLKPLLASTGLPVVRIEDEAWGWRITETPYDVR